MAIVRIGSLEILSSSRITSREEAKRPNTKHKDRIQTTYMITKPPDFEVSVIILQVTIHILLVSTE